MKIGVGSLPSKSAPSGFRICEAPQSHFQNRPPFLNLFDAASATESVSISRRILTC